MINNHNLLKKRASKLKAKNKIQAIKNYKKHKTGITQRQQKKETKNILNKTNKLYQTRN